MGSNPRWRRSVRRRARPTASEALSRVLDAAEDASPLEAVEAVTAQLSAALEASAAFFLIADISGRGLVRLSQASAGPGRGTRRARRSRGPAAARRRRAGRGPAGCQRRPRRGGAADPDRPGPAPRGPGRRGRTVGGAGTGDRARGGPRAAAAVAAARTGRRRAGGDRPGRARAVLRRDRQPAAHRPVRVGAAQRAVHPPRGDPATAAAGRLHLRGGGVHPVGVAGARGLHRRGHLRLQPGPRRPAPVGDRRDGSRRGQRPDRHLVRRQPAQHAPDGRHAARAGGRRQPGAAGARVRAGHGGVRDRPAGAPRPAHRHARAGQRRARPALPVPRRDGDAAASCR